MVEAVDSIYNLQEPAILAHPALDEPRRFGVKGKETGEPKYQGNLMLEPKSKDADALKALAIQVAKAAYPGRDIGAEFRAGKFALPFQSGTKLADARKAKLEAAGKSTDGEWQRDKLIIPARSKFQPRLGGFEKGHVVDYEGPAIALNIKKFFFGAEVYAQVNLVAYKGVGANPDGVTAYLNMVVATGKGTRITSAKSASEVFSGYAGRVSDEDPTAGGDDEIPF
jgi:hypothetical protein